MRNSQPFFGSEILRMNDDLECLDLSALLTIYIKESKAFAAALDEGASWDRLQEQRMRIRKISAVINNKYDGENEEVRQRSGPPHGC